MLQPVNKLRSRGKERQMGMHQLDRRVEEPVGLDSHRWEDWEEERRQGLDQERQVGQLKASVIRSDDPRLVRLSCSGDNTAYLDIRFTSSNPTTRDILNKSAFTTAAVYARRDWLGASAAAWNRSISRISAKRTGRREPERGRLSSIGSTRREGKNGISEIHATAPLPVLG